MKMSLKYNKKKNSNIFCNNSNQMLNGVEKHSFFKKISNRNRKKKTKKNCVFFVNKNKNSMNIKCYTRNLSKCLINISKKVRYFK